MVLSNLVLTLFMTQNFILIQLKIDLIAMDLFLEKKQK